MRDAINILTSVGPDSHPEGYNSTPTGYSKKKLLLFDQGRTYRYLHVHLMLNRCLRVDAYASTCR